MTPGLLFAAKITHRLPCDVRIRNHPKHSNPMFALCKSNLRTRHCTQCTAPSPRSHHRTQTPLAHLCRGTAEWPLYPRCRYQLTGRSWRRRPGSASPRENTELQVIPTAQSPTAVIPAAPQNVTYGAITAHYPKS